MKRRELVALDRLHPLVAILTKALETKDRQTGCLEGGKRLAIALLEKAISAHGSPNESPYPYLLVSKAIVLLLLLVPQACLENLADNTQALSFMCWFICGQEPDYCA